MPLRIFVTNFVCHAIMAAIVGGVTMADSPADLKLLMAVPDESVLQDDFSKSHPLPKAIWQARQGTRWTIEEGVLRGQPSSPEYQAKRKDHFGYEARLSIPATPPEFIAAFSFRFIGGSETAIVPFIEFGHHVCRIRFSKSGAELLSEGETMKIAEARDLIWESGKWYHALAEMKDGRFVLQIADGPTLFAERESFSAAPTSGGNGFGIAGPQKGQVELDDITIWTVKPEVQPGWPARMAGFPKFTPVQVKQPKKK